MTVVWRGEVTGVIGPAKGRTRWRAMTAETKRRTCPKRYRLLRRLQGFDDFLDLDGFGDEIGAEGGFVGIGRLDRKGCDLGLHVGPRHDDGDLARQLSDHRRRRSE